MKIYFITRFSILDYQHKAFELSRNFDAAEYEKSLFNKDRLEHKFEVFEKNTLSSILSQSNKDWEWHIYTSDRLPRHYKNRLGMLIEKEPRIKIFAVNGFKEFNKNVTQHKYTSNYATVRLDDDDGLCDKYVEKLQKYTDEKDKIISFPLGRRIEITKGKKVVGNTFESKNIAVGLAGIGLEIYSCGNHATIDQRYETIYDLTPNIYFINCSKHCDTQREFIDFKKLYLFKVKVYLNSCITKYGYKIINKESAIKSTMRGSSLPKNKCVKCVDNILNKIGYSIVKADGKTDGK